MSTVEETEPAAKVWICPACGARYSEPTMCTNQHAPTAALEYDLTAEEAAAETAEETAETAAPVEPAPVETAAPVEPAPPAGPAPVDPAPVAAVDPSGLQQAFAALDDAVAGLRTKLGL